jgi:mannose-6-phosphate isomerase-like protein (cupin superfamily)
MMAAHSKEIKRMSVVDPTPAEMKQRTARFSELKPYKDSLNEAHGIPPEAMQMMSSDKVYPIMSPEGWTGRSKIAPVKGAPGLTITLAECPPGDSAGLHKHTDSVENFFCVEGRFEIVWGAQGEHCMELGPLDFVSIPKGVYRDFRNVGDVTGRLLVAIQTPPGDTRDTVVHAPEVGQEIARRFGDQTLDAMAALGVRFGD